MISSLQTQDPTIIILISFISTLLFDVYTDQQHIYEINRIIYFLIC